MIRVGCVNFINAYPLTKNLKGFELIYDIPSKLADMLHDGVLDIALVSSIEYAKRFKDYTIIKDLCIGSDKKVCSITLFSNLKIGNIKTVGYDRSTRSSITLLKIIMKEMNKVVKYEEEGNNLEKLLRIYDSVLLIGDNALKNRDYPSKYKYDLGELWNRITGLPFVYALWVCKKDLEVDPNHFKDQYLKNIDNISTLLNNDEKTSFNINYLENIIKYDLTSERLKGLNLFYKKSFENGFIEKIPQIKFID